MTRPTDWYVLDLSRDPTPGDPYGVRALARWVLVVAEDASAAERDVRGLAGDDAMAGWIGLAAEVFRGALEDFPSQLRKLSASYGQCAEALSTYAVALRGCQEQADRALREGRRAQAEIATLTGQLSAARSAASSASSAAASLDRPASAGAPPPDPAQVRAAARNATAANDRVSALARSLDGAQARLSAAKKLAREAEELRQQAGDRAKSEIGDASDAGIKPNSFWEDFKSGAAKVWKVTIQIAKVAVAVLGIVVLIIGGPLAWVVVGLSVLILADALMKVANGQGSWLDVASAALGLIPGTRGLTSLTALKNAAALGGKMGVLAHLGSTGVNVLKGAANGARVVWQGRAALPLMLKALPGTARARLLNMALDLRSGAPGAVRGVSQGLSGASGLSRVSAGFREGRASFVAARDAARDPAWLARSWQGKGPYFGVDRWTSGTLTAGTKLEAGYPGLGNFVVPRGTMDDVLRDAHAYNEGVQVGANPQPPYDAFRSQGIRLDVVNDVPAANGFALANPQFGAGGTAQHFVPNLDQHLLDGNIVPVGPNGAPLKVTANAEGRPVIHTPQGSTIPMSNFDTTNPNVFSAVEIKAIQAGLKDLVTAVRVPYSAGSNIATLVP